MAGMPDLPPPSPSQIVTELLAAERTFLAWVRTSIAVASLGFVVAKFGIWLREFAAQLTPQIHMHSTALSLPIGIAMMLFGGALTIGAAWHFRIASRSIMKRRDSLERPAHRGGHAGRDASDLRDDRLFAGRRRRAVKPGSKKAKTRQTEVWRDSAPSQGDYQRRGTANLRRR